MGIPVSLTYHLTAGDDDGICTSQTPGGAGNLTIDGALASGGVATLNNQRQVLFTFAADETGHTLTIYGTNNSGTSISETIAGNGTGSATTVLNYKTVTRVAIDAAATGAIKVGTNGVGASEWKLANYHVTPVNLGIACIVTGTISYTFQYTTDPDPCGIFTNTASTAVNAFDLSALASKSATLDSSMTTPITAWRIKVNSGTGSVTVNLIEGGLVG
jgi:hypothetical protein